MELNILWEPLNIKITEFWGIQILSKNKWEFSHHWDLQLSKGMVPKKSGKLSTFCG